MKNKIIASLVVVLWVSGCSTPTDPTEKNSGDKLPSPSVPPTVVEEIPYPQTPSNSYINQTSCADHESSVNQAVQDNDLETLESLLTTLNDQPDCPVDYLDGVKRSMAQIAALQADSLVQRAALQDDVGQQRQLLDEAEAVLKRATTTTWQTQAVHGDIAAYRKQWRDAALLFAQALDLVDNFQVTHKTQVPEAKIKEIFQSALDAQLLAAEMVMPIRQRSIGIEDYPIPVQFKFGSNKMGAAGKQAVQQLAKYLRDGEFTKVTLTGHTDEKGSHAVNDRISKQRALTVKKYLHKQGNVKAKIDTDGKGERQLLPQPRWKNLTKTETDRRNRRVEFKTD